MKVAFAMQGTLPSPAVLGGVAEAWLDRILKENEQAERITPTIINVWDPEAQQQAADFPKARFVMIQRSMMPFQAIKRVAARMGSLNMDQAYYRRVAKALGAQDWDAVVVMGEEALVNAAARVTNAPIVWWRYGDSPVQEAVPSTVRQIWSYGAGTEAHRDAARLLPSVDLECFDASRYDKERQKLRDRWHVSQEDIVFTCIGAQPDQVRWVLNAFEALDMPFARLILIGADDKNAVMREWMRTPRETSKRVAFAGALSPQSLPLCHAAADIIILPSPDKQMLWEAMASGRCVISGYPTQEAGILAVANENVEDLTEAMRTLHGEAQRRAKVGASLRQQAEGMQPVYAYRQTVDLLSRLCGPALTPPPPVSRR